MDAETITKHCQAKFAANVEFPPKVLDAGETMVLFNFTETMDSFVWTRKTVHRN